MPSPSDLAWWVWLLIAAGAGILAGVAYGFADYASDKDETGRSAEIAILALVVDIQCLDRCHYGNHRDRSFCEVDLDELENAMATQKELALTLLQKIIDLETERIAMANLLDFARHPETNQPLIWRPMVQANRDEILRDIVHAKYAGIERSIRDSTPECPNVLSLLESVLSSLV